VRRNRTWRDTREHAGERGCSYLDRGGSRRRAALAAAWGDCTPAGQHSIAI
jgi:hypothetical protein